MTSSFFDPDFCPTTPSERLLFQYSATIATWRIYFSSRLYNPEPFSLVNLNNPPDELDPELESIANERALFGSSMEFLYFKDIALWDKFAKLMLSPVKLSDGSLRPSDVNFICRVLFLMAQYRVGDRQYPEEWRERTAAYLRARWPDYKGQYVNVALLEEWEKWALTQYVESVPSCPKWKATLGIEYIYRKHQCRMLWMKCKSYCKALFR